MVTDYGMYNQTCEKKNKEIKILSVRTLSILLNCLLCGALYYLNEVCVKFHLQLSVMALVAHWPIKSNNCGGEKSHEPRVGIVSKRT